MIKILFVLILFILSAKIIIADEGMWIPILLEKYNYEDMKKKGFKLTPEDIYSINKACLKDAIVIFGKGCTGELISDKGLIITNHHCGYSQIQAHSTIDHDYLTDGFWAMSQTEELTNPALTVQFLVRMEDVTAKILKDISDTTSEANRQKIIKKHISELTKMTTEGNHYNVSIKPFYYGNEYYMFIYEEFKDIRLVGAPPSGIGKFGGDTDNWMWPRHTGDFSLFRIYANRKNEPADYAPENVPYKPKKSLQISIKGVKKDDFTFVFGYPGRTAEYLTSFGVEQIYQVKNPHLILIRKKILDIMGEDMKTSNQIRIQYAFKYASFANGWKKWMGENKGLQKLNAIEKKKALEAQFQTWADANEDRKKKYGSLLQQFEKCYKEVVPINLVTDYLNEITSSVDLIEVVRQIYLALIYTQPTDLQKTITSLKTFVKKTYKDVNINTDKKLFSSLMKMYCENIDSAFKPQIFSNAERKFDGNYNKYTDYIYSESIFANEEKLLKFLDNYKSSSQKKLQKDPAFIHVKDMIDMSIKVGKKVSANVQIENLYRLWIAGLREMQTDKLFYPDANFTLRVTYGKVDNYEPADGVTYNYFTTLDGIIAKDDSLIYDYRVPKKLKELYKQKDFGKYSENGVMKVAFTASNHTTGGNSGSPVLNAEGQLIGVNFDRNWEGTMSDIMYDPSQCRNIAIDIRYALFIIDKFAGAGHLIKEMNIVE